jgi:hypothetical protein
MPVRRSGAAAAGTVDRIPPWFEGWRRLGQTGEGMVAGFMNALAGVLAEQVR